MGQRTESRLVLRKRGIGWSKEARGMVVNGVEGELIGGGVLD